MRRRIHHRQAEASAHNGTIADLRGASRLAVDAVVGVTDMVESMHHAIVRVSPFGGNSHTGRLSGISGLVYRSVRGVTQLIGISLDAALERVGPLLAGSIPGTAGASWPGRESLLAAVNGVLGDHLVAAGNPLAIPMRLRRDGQALLLERESLAREFPDTDGRLLVMLHGLCMSDVGWRRDGHDHGAALAHDLGFTSLYLHYNSGRHISSNGADFAAIMEELVAAWPVPVRELVIVGHSMGGLVARSACQQARLAGNSWLAHLSTIVFLGTPHHGSPLERAGNRLELLLGISPYTAAFARLGRIRSAGVKDLRHGNLLDEDWAPHASGHVHDVRATVPLPDGVRCFALAASSQLRPGAPGQRLAGDGLVPVDSALGRHPDPARTLPIPESRQRVFYALHHFDLLSRGDVYAQIRRCLSSD
jgi:pimeloyl-ACP methyl ester carboxylesterase